jgi:hypothetical protein
MMKFSFGSCNQFGIVTKHLYKVGLAVAIVGYYDQFSTVPNQSLKSSGGMM